MITDRWRGRGQNPPIFDKVTSGQAPKYYKSFEPRWRGEGGRGSAEGRENRYVNAQVFSFARFNDAGQKIIARNPRLKTLER